MSTRTSESFLINFIEGTQFPITRKGSFLTEQKTGLDKRWFEVKTYSDLIRLNIEFIQGKISMTPYNSQPVSNYTDKMFRILISLHQHGILLVDSQKSMCKYGEFTVKTGNSSEVNTLFSKSKSKQILPEDDSEISMSEDNKYWTDVEKRSYLSFYVDLSTNKKLVKSIINQIQDSNLIFRAYNFIKSTTYTNINVDETIPLKRERFSKRREDLIKAKWNTITELPRRAQPKELLWNDFEASKPILFKSMHFILAASNFCEDNLEEILLTICTRV